MGRRYTQDDLARIFDRCSGRCHLCHGPLALYAYGRTDDPRGWEVDHSVARKRGGSDRLQNLFPAHPACNRSKRTANSRAFRLSKGHRYAPLSVNERRKAKARNAVGVGAACWLVASLFWPPLRILAAISGAALGHEADPDRAREWWAGE